MSGRNEAARNKKAWPKIGYIRDFCEACLAVLLQWPKIWTVDDFCGWGVWDWRLPSLQVDCSEYRRLERGRPIYCERLYQPFCGSDGKTYNNKCSFCKAVLWVLSCHHPWGTQKLAWVELFGICTPQKCWVGFFFRIVTSLLLCFSFTQ